ncbi:MAG: stage III sporulation protein AG [Oscillospiraceae bacterium]|nr:stage III sporulation protein AG [Oscillospiraceae bacterium]
MNKDSKTLRKSKNQTFLFKNILDKFARKEGFKKIVVAVGILGIILVFVSSFLKPGTTLKSERNKTSAQTYIEQMQKNLEYLISNIEGAGKSEVLITLENGSEIIYAREEKKNQESSEDKAKGELGKIKQSDDFEIKYITVRESDGNERALQIKEVEPKVKGVVVVCEGGNNKNVKEKIINAIKTIFSILKSQVFVTR